MSNSSHAPHCCAYGFQYPTPLPFGRIFLQGQDGEVRWVMYQLGYIGTGLMGVIGFGVSGCWLAHIIIYMLPPVPIHPLLNEVFIKLDGVFPLFGVAAFAAFCAYLMGECYPNDS